MKIKIKYFSKDYPRLEKIKQGDWIDLRIDKLKDIDTGAPRGLDLGIVLEAQKEHNTKLNYRKGDIIKLGLGVAMELPKGHEAEIRPRSSTFKHFGLMQTNSVGTIDNSYNGNNDEWQIEFIAMKDGVIERFDRVCQFRIWENQPNFEFEEVDKLGNEDRGGYGSTGNS